MTLAELQKEIVENLYPGQRALCRRCPELVARTIRRLVLVAPARYPAPFFGNDDGREAFMADLIADDELPMSTTASLWLVLLLQVIVPALIRAFIEWWSSNHKHREAVAELRATIEGYKFVEPDEPNVDTQDRAWGVVLVILGLAMIIALLLASGLALGTEAAPPQHETEICKSLTARLAKDQGGKWSTEFRLWDDTRVDLLSEEYAVEVDFAHKWAECIGQALYYGHLTDRQPVCLLLASGTSDDHFVYRCQTVCEAHGIKLWVYSLDASTGKLGK